jgi:hypothetical protein
MSLQDTFSIHSHIGQITKPTEKAAKSAVKGSGKERESAGSTKVKGA